MNQLQGGELGGQQKKGAKAGLLLPRPAPHESPGFRCARSSAARRAQRAYPRRT